MLKNRYQEVIVGLNPISLIRGLIARKRNLSTLLIDDKRFKSESYPLTMISELEILALLRLGGKHDIPELASIRQFLLPATVEMSSDKTWLRIGRSPFENLIEVLRKFPELSTAAELEEIYENGEKEFNQLFFSELNRYERLLHEAGLKPKGIKFELQGPKWLKNTYLKFSDFINQEYGVSQNLKYAGLLHLMGVAFEDKLKTKLSPTEVPFYFFRLFSPLYRLQDFFLITQLKRRLLLEGGDYKESTVQYWQLFDGKFENLLLASFEGVISGDRVLFFSHLPVEVPFAVTSPYPFYRKAQIVPVKTPSFPYPPTDFTFRTELESMGSERPYRAWAQDKDLSYYHYPYLAMAGSKSEFYDRPMLANFEEDRARKPIPNQSLKTMSSLGVSLDLRSLRKLSKADAPVLEVLPLKITTPEERPIEGFEYWGPLRYRSLGVLALCYGIEGT